MVNILIHQFQSGGEVADADALKQFQQQWATYQKLVDADALGHRETARILHETLAEAFAAPFSFLDIACGDASEMPSALAGTKIRHYHGIDLSQPALELAANNLKDAPFEVELDHRDFIEAIIDRAEAADAAWCSLSIHHLHTEGKLRLLKALHDATGTMLMIYEPVRQDSETRDAYLERFRAINGAAWTTAYAHLTPEEWAQIDRHVSTCDFPETDAGWLDLGLQAGFSKAERIFLDPTGFYALYRYDR